MICNHFQLRFFSFTHLSSRIAHKCGEVKPLNERDLTCYLIAYWANFRSFAFFLIILRCLPRAQNDKGFFVFRSGELSAYTKFKIQNSPITLNKPSSHSQTPGFHISPVPFRSLIPSRPQKAISDQTAQNHSQNNSLLPAYLPLFLLPFSDLR